MPVFFYVKMILENLLLHVFLLRKGPEPDRNPEVLFISFCLSDGENRHLALFYVCL